MMTRSATIYASMSKDLKKSQKYMKEMEKVVQKIKNESLAKQQLESASSTSIFKDPIVQVAASVRKSQILLRQVEKKKLATKKKKTTTN